MSPGKVGHRQNNGVFLLPKKFSTSSFITLSYCLVQDYILWGRNDKKKLLCYNVHMKKQAFTLIELLIVITIIAILASVVFIALDPLTRLRTARDTTRVEQMNEIKQAMALYLVDNGHYPIEVQWASGSITSPTLGTTYLATIPKAPTPDGDCTVDQNNYSYTATPINNPTTYTVTFCLGAAIESFTAGSHTLIAAGIIDGVSSGGSTCSQDSDCTSINTNDICVSGHCTDHIIYSNSHYTCGSNVSDLCTYHIAKVGNQYWLKENINIGARINILDGNSSFQNQENFSSGIQKYCYDNNEILCATYGGLYQWHTFMGFDQSCDGNYNSDICNITSRQQGLCPDGWHVPTDSEWWAMAALIDSDSVFGGYLKETGTSHWSSPNVGATDAYGFTALPAGLIIYNSFASMGNNTFFWTATSEGNSSVYAIYLNSSNSEFNISSYGGATGFSARCVKDQN